MISKKQLLRLFIALAILAAIGMAVKKWGFAEPPPEYLTAPVTRMHLEEAVLATGTLEPIQQVNVGAQVNGQLKSLKVKLGDRVKKGMLLAEIDPVLQQNDLRNAEASLENFKAQKRAREAQLTQYELAYARQKKMFEYDASSQADLETAKAQVDSTRAELAALDAQIVQANVQVDTARANLGYTRIVAPIDGEIISIVTQEGQTVVSMQTAPTILIMANLDTMTVKAQISEADVIRIRPGMPVYFTTLGDPDTKHRSTLRAVEPAPDNIATSSQATVSAATSTAVYYNGLFDIDNADHVLRPSMTAQVSIVLGEADNALTVPVTALGKKVPGGYEVRTLKNGVPETRTVKTGLNNNINVEVLEGLSEGEQVIVSGDVKGNGRSGNGDQNPPPRMPPPR